MSKFATCPDCGSNLDHGEKCSCKDSPRRETAKAAGKEASQQAAKDHREPVLAYGE